MNNLFLTGEINVGKSTILDHSLRKFAKGLKISGFKTVPLCYGEIKNKFYYMVDINNNIIEKSKYYLCKKKSDGRLEPNLHTFEIFGVNILKKCLNSSSDIIVMDEIGVFESKAINFQTYVKKCLDSSIPVFGVIKKKENLFLNEIKKRTDVMLMNVTLKNREEVKNKFCYRMDSIIKKHQNEL